MNQEQRNNSNNKKVVDETMTTKQQQGNNHDAMLNYPSQWEVVEYFGGKKTSYFSIIQVVDNFFSM